MASSNAGKDVILEWIRKNFPTDAHILDVGACDGKWQRNLPEYKMDAVDAWEPNCIQIRDLYENVYHKDVAEFQYGKYDLIIFGDVIEHMDVPTAQAVLEYASKQCRDMIVAVPFEYPQGPIYGNPWEIHKQPDLTAEIMAERYPTLEVLHDTGKRYCYYHKKQPKARKKRAKK